MDIVVAEDSVLFREGLERILREAGHEVRAVADADALVEEVQGQAARPGDRRHPHASAAHR